MSAAARIEGIQAHLETIYAIRSIGRAADFLLTAEQAARLGSTGRAEEELLVAEDPEGQSLEVGLYFSPALLASECSELRTYCQVAEGVSHFVYLSQVASEGRQVSMLELEAQAEVDKFVTSLLLRWTSSNGPSAQALHRRLFHDVSYLSGLEPHERARYEEANRVARNYCTRLMAYVGSRRLDRLLAELRYSYRLGADAKMRHLDRDR